RNRSTNGAHTRSLNGKATGSQVAHGPSDQAYDAVNGTLFKFGTVNRLLGGIDSAAVGPDGSVYYVFGIRDLTTNKNRLEMIRLTPNATGGLTLHAPTFVAGQVQAALPSVPVTSIGMV